MIGKAIEKRRESLGLSRENLADKSGISRQQIYNLEIGKYAPLYATVRSIAKALEIGMDDLEALSEEMEAKSDNKNI